jgi:hypothetical protein
LLERREIIGLAKNAWMVLCAVVPVAVIGCGEKSTATGERQQVELRAIYDVYQQFTKSQRKPPSQLSDLAKKEYEVVYPAPMTALKQGKYVAVWNVSGKDSGTVLAYEKDAPTNGGAVLMADGSIKTMSAAEFKTAAPQAK